MVYHTIRIIISAGYCTWDLYLVSCASPPSQTTAPSPTPPSRDCSQTFKNEISKKSINQICLQVRRKGIHPLLQHRSEFFKLQCLYVIIEIQGLLLIVSILLHIFHRVLVKRDVQPRLPLLLDHLLPLFKLLDSLSGFLGHVLVEEEAVKYLLLLRLHVCFLC